MIDEFIVDWPNGNKKMLWVSKGNIFNLIDSNGGQVPVFHAEYAHAPGTMGEDKARERLQALWDQNTKLKDGKPTFSFDDCKISDPFKRVAAKLEDEEFLKAIAQANPDNQALTRAIGAVRILCALANYDPVKDRPLQPTPTPNGS